MNLPEPSLFVPLGEKALARLIKASRRSGPQASFPKTQAEQNVVLKAPFSKVTFWVDFQVLQRWWVNRGGQIFFPTGYWFWELKQAFSQCGLASAFASVPGNP